jgi:hypothetical protein
MLTEGRKQELVDELRMDLEKYIKSQQLIPNFIDSTCQTDEEIEFLHDVEWWVSVV